MSARDAITERMERKQRLHDAEKKAEKKAEKPEPKPDGPSGQDATAATA